MSKRAYESAALTGFEVTVPAPVPREPDAAPTAASGATYEDSWYRTLRVMSDSPQDDVQREGGLVEEPEPTQAEPQVLPPALTLAPPPKTIAAAPRLSAEDEPPTAPQASPDSYEDSWYQILKSRRAVGEE
jgi:hypothetical protein